MCHKKKNQNKPEQANTVEPQKQDEQVYNMFHIQSETTQPYRVVVTANGVPLPIEIETGASVSEDSLRAILEGVSTLELQDTAVKLQIYTEEAITLSCSVMVPVEHNGQSTTLPLIVTEGNAWKRLVSGFTSGLEQYLLIRDNVISPTDSQGRQ